MGRTGPRLGGVAPSCKMLSILLQDFVFCYCYSKQGAMCCCFQTTFSRLYSDLHLNDTAMWSHFARSSQCEQDFPTSVAKKLSPFEQVLVVQAVRPDRLQSAMAGFAANALGTVSKFCTRCHFECFFLERSFRFQE